MMHKTDKFICATCAHINAGRWPEGNEATHWWGVCDFCKEQKAVCLLADWSWDTMPSSAQSIFPQSS